MTKDIRVYFDDILEALRKIDSYTAGMEFSSFSGDSKTIDATVRNFEVIGEAAKKVPEETKMKYPGIPWKSMAGMRDKLIHDYFGVDNEVLWMTIKEDIPPLQPLLEEALREFNEELRDMNTLK